MRLLDSPRNLCESTKTYQRARRPKPGRTFYCGRHGNRANKLIWVDTKGA